MYNLLACTKERRAPAFTYFCVARKNVRVKGLNEK